MATSSQDITVHGSMQPGTLRSPGCGSRIFITGIDQVPVSMLLQTAQSASPLGRCFSQPQHGASGLQFEASASVHSPSPPEVFPMPD